MTSLRDGLRADAALRRAHADHLAGGSEDVRLGLLALGVLRAAVALGAAAVRSARGADPVLLPAPGVDDVLTEPRP